MGGHIEPTGLYKDWLTTQRVEEIRKERGEELEKTAAQKSPDLLLFAGLLLRTRKIFNNTSLVPISETPSALISHLVDLKNCLLELHKTDQSQNIDFVQKFTDSWTRLIHAMEWINRKDMIAITATSALLGAIGSYPLNQEHSLGFYLSRFAGEKWLPFPLIELLSSLNTNKKLLMEWVRTVDALISHLSNS
ncbi:MAG: hypothetical protein JSR58_00865 [Verrucomicrobia bacterium]|nr:hypothetical protein [Verrucomicrobiota bacterium]